MPPELGPALAVTFAGRPAHMSAVDFVLWQRFRRLFPPVFDRLYFDVAVGPGAAGAPDTPDNVAAAWQRITRHRIDVVGESPSAWILIELRAAAGPGALGSLLVYRDLWLADPPDARPIRLWLVTDIFPDALKPSLDAASIRLFLV